MPVIVATFFSAADTPLTSPANTPTIRIRRTDTQALVVTDAAMTEQGDGNFSYDFTPVDGLEYAVRADGDPTAVGQTVAGGRYVFGAFSGTQETRIETDIPAILVDTGTTLPAAIASVQSDTDDIQTRLPAALVGGRMDADVGNMQTDALDADALAADAVAEIADGVWDEAVSGHQTAGTFGRNATTIAQEGTVSGGASSTVVPTSITGLGDDFLNNLQVVFFDGSGNSVARNVDDYTSATGTFTVADLGFTPAAASVVYVLRRTGSSAVDTASIADAVWDEVKAGHVIAGTFGEEVQMHSTSAEIAAVQADTDDIQTRLPAALVGGRMDSNVGFIQPNAVNAAALATDAVDEIADGVWDEAIVGHSGAGSAGLELQNKADDGAAMDLVPNAVDATSVANGAIDSNTFVAGAIDADAIATDAITADKIAANAIGASELATDAIGADQLATSAVDEVVDQVWEEQISDHSGTVGSTAEALDAASTGGTTPGAVADAVWDEAIAGHVAAGSFGAEVQSHSTSAEVASVQADTDDIQTRLPAALVGGRMDSDVGNMQASVLTAIENEVLDAAASGHTTQGTVGEAVLLQLYAENAVWVDQNAGTAGTTVGVNGTVSNPVTTLTDALSLANSLGIKKLRFIGTTQFHSIIAGMTNFVFEFDSAQRGDTIDFNNQSVSGCIFKQCTVFGTQSTGSCSVVDGVMFGVTDFNGQAFNTQIFADIGHGSGASYFDCVGEDTFGTPEIDMSGHTGDVIMQNYSGKLIISGQANASQKTEVAFITGDVEIQASCTLGDVVVRGLADIVDSSGAGCTVDSTNLVAPIVDAELTTNHSAGSWSGTAAADIADAVLTEVVSDHSSVAGSLAEAVAIAKGLAQDQYMLDNTTYDANGFLTAGRIRVFPTAAALAAATDGGVGEGEDFSFTIAGTPDGVQVTQPNTVKVSRP